MTHFWQHKMYALAILFLIIGGANWGIIALTGKDIVTSLTGATFANAIFLVVGISALALAMYRDTYFPFLGQTVIPCSVLKPTVPDGADFEVKIRAEPGQKVMYWAAEPGTEHLQKLPDWRQAYLEYKNAGVALVDDTGNATLRVRKPQPYSVPLKGKLSPHIHYRVCLGGGFLGSVQTVTLNGEEWFENVPEEEEEIEGFAGGNPIPPAFSKENFGDIPSAAEMDKMKALALASVMKTTEGFENNVRRQEQNAPADVATGFDYVKPDSALAEVNQVAADTLTNSLMPQTGGFDEGGKEKGTDMSRAFAPTPFH